MSASRIAIFGAAGQLGAALVETFRTRGHDVRALTRREVDVTDAAAVAAAIRAHQAEVVLNATAYNQVDAAESDPEGAFRANALAVRHLARASAEQGAKLIHYSTDYVFDGRQQRPYRETDSPAPLGAYGVSKLAGEAFALAEAAGALVIRVAAVFGPAGARTPRGNFVETMLRLARQGKPLRVVADQVTSPTYTIALAERTYSMLERGASGLYHAGGGTAISWHDFAAAIFRAAGLHPELVPIPSAEYPTPARRPAYSALGNVKLAALGVPPFPPLDDCLRDYFGRSA